MYEVAFKVSVFEVLWIKLSGFKLSEFKLSEFKLSEFSFSSLALVGKSTAAFLASTSWGESDTREHEHVCK